MQKNKQNPLLFRDPPQELKSPGNGPRQLLHSCPGSRAESPKPILCLGLIGCTAGIQSEPGTHPTALPFTLPAFVDFQRRRHALEVAGCQHRSVGFVRVGGASQHAVAKSGLHWQLFLRRSRRAVIDRAKQRGLPAGRYLRRQFLSSDIAQNSRAQDPKDDQPSTIHYKFSGQKPACRRRAKRAVRRAGSHSRNRPEPVPSACVDSSAPASCWEGAQSGSCQQLWNARRQRGNRRQGGKQKDRQAWPSYIRWSLQWTFFTSVRRTPVLSHSFCASLDRTLP